MATSKVRGRIARAAISAVLTGTMAFGGVMAPVGTALAEGGTLTIVQSNGTDAVTDSYKAYQLFTVTMSDGKVTDAQWVAGAETSVYNFLSTYDGDSDSKIDYFIWLKEKGYTTLETGPATGNTVQENRAHLALNAAQFISERIQESADAGVSYSNKNGENVDYRITKDGSFSNQLAAVVARAGITPKESSSGVFSEISAGYYLVVPEKDGTVSTDTPIWYLHDGESTDAKIVKKDAQATLDKQVKLADGTFGMYEDYAEGDKVTFKLTAQTTNTANTTYTITDELPEGMKLVLNNDSPVIEAKVGTAAVTGVTPAWDSDQNTLTVTFTAAASDSTETNVVKANDKVEITYEATVENNAKTGNELNPNTAVMKHDNATTDDTDDDVETTEATASVATYKINVTKVEKGSDSDITLAGAKYSISKKVTVDEDEKTLYLTTAGAWKELEEGESITKDSTDYLFTTASDGTLAMPLVDKDIEYSLKEIVAPTGYKVASGAVTVTISADLDPDNGTISNFDATVTGETDGKEIDAEKGTVSIKIADSREITLPITGMTPSQTATLLGTLLVAAGAVTIVVRRRAEGAQA